MSPLWTGWDYLSDKYNSVHGQLVRNVWPDDLKFHCNWAESLQTIVKRGILSPFHSMEWMKWDGKEWGINFVVQKVTKIICTLCTYVHCVSYGFLTHIWTRHTRPRTLAPPQSAKSKKSERNFAQNRLFLGCLNILEALRKKFLLKINLSEDFRASGLSVGVFDPFSSFEGILLLMDIRSQNPLCSTWLYC